MEPQLSIRAATENDVSAIFDITRDAFGKYARDLGLPERVTALSETLDAIRLDMRQKHVLVATLDGVPVGSIRYETACERVAYISRFGVKPEAQGLGVGRALISAVKEACIAEEYLAIALHTASRMFSLVRFYYGQGFYIYSTTQHRGYTRALLVKELSRDARDIPFDTLVPEH